MTLLKQTKDLIVKAISGRNYVPVQLLNLNKYFRHYGAIKFALHQEDDVIVSVSTNFRYGSIIACGKNEKELEVNTKDAILTSFEIPSAYKKEACIVREGEKANAYALA